MKKKEGKKGCHSEHGMKHKDEKSDKALIKKMVKKTDLKKGK
jgi:hypothetical protein